MGKVLGEAYDIKYFQMYFLVKIFWKESRKCFFCFVFFFGQNAFQNILQYMMKETNCK